MRLSKILRTVTIVMFWSAIGLFVHWFYTLEGEIWAVIVASAVTPLVTVFARMPKKKGFAFLFHLLALAVPAIFMVTGKIPIPIMLYGMGIVVFSYIMKLADSELMDRGNGFGCVVLAIMYLIGSLMEYDLIWVHFILMVGYIFLVFIETNIQQNEDYLEKVSYHSVVDVKKITNTSNVVILAIGVAMLVICVSFALLGKIGPLAAFSAFLRLKWKSIFGFLKRLKYQEEEESGPQVNEDAQIPPMEDLPEGGEAEIPEVTTGDIIVTALLYSFFICTFLYALYALIKRLYRKYLQFQSEGVMEEQVHIKKNKTKEINPAKLDKSYNNRMAIRKIYKKRIKGKRSGRREDLINCTPMEQRDKSINDGNDISNELVEMYEKARYSNENISKADVKKMGSL